MLVNHLDLGESIFFNLKLSKALVKHFLSVNDHFWSLGDHRWKSSFWLPDQSSGVQNKQLKQAEKMGKKFQRAEI